MELQLAKFIVEALNNSPIGYNYALPQIEGEYNVNAAYNETTVAVVMEESLLEFTSAIALDCQYSDSDPSDERINRLRAISKLRTASIGVRRIVLY